MAKKNQRFATVGIIPLIPLLVVLGLSAAVWAGLAFSSQSQTSSPAQGTAPISTYSDNDLTCSSPTGTTPAVASLVTRVADDSRFTSLTKGSPYVFEYADNITGRSITTGGVLLDGPTQNGSVIGGVTVHLPDLVELVFYSYGPNTSCGDTGTSMAIDSIVVQVPVDAGGFNMTGATFEPSAPTM
jgi:hypothetical protein